MPSSPVVESALSISAISTLLRSLVIARFETRPEWQTTRCRPTLHPVPATHDSPGSRTRAPIRVRAMRLHVVDHPLVAHKITNLRDVKTDSPTFRRLVDQLVTLLAY